MRWLLPALGLAAALGTFVALRVPSSHPPPDILLKGTGPALHLFRLVDQKPQRLSDGAHVKPHDVVQVAFELKGAPHLAVVSVDGAGHSTLHWPLDGDTRAPDGLKAVPNAFELDEAPGFERFFLVTAQTPLDVPALLEAATRAGKSASLPIPAGAVLRSLLLEKDPR